VLQTGKRKVEMSGLEPVGNYAVKPIFSDGHVSGIYTWAYLYKLGRDEAGCGKITCNAWTLPVTAVKLAAICR